MAIKGAGDILKAGLSAVGIQQDGKLANVVHRGIEKGLSAVGVQLPPIPEGGCRCAQAQKWLNKKLPLGSESTVLIPNSVPIFGLSKSTEFTVRGKTWQDVGAPPYIPEGWEHLGSCGAHETKVATFSEKGKGYIVWVIKNGRYDFSRGYCCGNYKDDAIRYMKELCAKL